MSERVKDRNKANNKYCSDRGQWSRFVLGCHGGFPNRTARPPSEKPVDRSPVPVSASFGSTWHGDRRGEKPNGGGNKASGTLPLSRRAGVMCLAEMVFLVL